jgi:hypothetical protein
MRSFVSVLPICRDVVHCYLFLLWSEIILAPFDSAASIGTGAGEVTFAVLVGEANNAPTFSFSGAQVMRHFAILVEVTRYLAVTAGVAITTASEAS